MITNRFGRDVDLIPHKTSAVGLAKKCIRGGLNLLDGIASVRPQPQGAVSWTEVDVSGWGEGDSSSISSREAESVRWIHGSPMRDIGICRVRMAEVCFFKPRPDESVNPLDRRAVVRVSPFRRVAIPGPYLFSAWARNLRHGRKTVSRRCGRLRERVALLGNAGSDSCNYYHFWIDTVGDLLMLRDALPVDLQPDRFLVSYGAQPWQEQILEMVGIESRQLVRYADHERLRCDELLIPVRDKGALNITAGLVDRIRRSVSLPALDREPYRCLYISRGDSVRRPVRNEAAVQALVQRHGLEVKELSGITVIEQIGLFAAARLVVATHGAGLTNLMWCQEGTVVIELLPDLHRIPCFREICRQRKLEHRVIVCPQSGSENTALGAMEVPLHHLEEALKENGHSAMPSRVAACSLPARYAGTAGRTTE